VLLNELRNCAVDRSRETALLRTIFQPESYGGDPMPLHPLAKDFLDLPFMKNAKPLHTLSVQEARKEFADQGKFMPPGEPVARVEDLGIPGLGGDIPVRVYTPDGEGPFPLYVHFHGGGWVLGDLDSQDADCRVIANAAACVVVSVNYRHAPEHKFPTAAEDAYRATAWVADNASRVNGDAARLAVGGMSAGGNLAAVVALMSRDRGGPSITYQVLIVPVTNYAFDTRSYQENGEEYVLTTEVMQWFWAHYLSTPADGANPYASPLRAPDLRGLPPAFVMTAEYDPLRDEGHAYAERLREAGVDVSYQCNEGMLHMFHGPQGLQDVAHRLRAAFTLPR
jgi:acetyl esterase